MSRSTQKIEAPVARRPRPPTPRVGGKKASDFPDVARTFDRKKNAGLRPEDVPAGSGRPLWWRCPEGRDHPWSASSARRTTGRKCPFCAGKRASVTNSVASLMPESARWFDLTKNAPMRPEDVHSGSEKKLWWRCPEGPDHVWESSPFNLRKSKGCPFCTGRRLSVTNSLATRAPHLVKEWHSTKNRPLKPDQIV